VGVVVVFGTVAVGVRMVDAPPATLTRDAVDAMLGRAAPVVVAENAPPVTMAIARTEHTDKNLIVLFILL
jgi:hypothetical protein